MGAYLHSARRRRRVSVERAAEDTKIRADYLMRMESDEFDFLAPAYVRGFLKTYAKYLRVDPDPLIHEYERRYAVRSLDTAHLLAEGSRRNASPGPRKINSWTVAGAAALVVIVALGLIGVTQGRNDSPQQVAERGGESNEESQAPAPEETTTPDGSPSPAETEDELALADGVEVTIDATRSDCWVDVTADGTKLWSDTIPAGSSQTFTAEKGMTIILGFPQGVDLIVNGRSFGAPGGPDPVTIKLPDDIDSL
jgi:cytoskeleton protein RodZ